MRIEPGPEPILAEFASGDMILVRIAGIRKWLPTGHEMFVRISRLSGLARTTAMALRARPTRI